MALALTSTLAACNTDRNDGNGMIDRTNGNNSVGDAVGTAGRAVDAAAETVDIKAALIAERGLDSSNINVDTDRTTKMVMLKGSVPTDAQKSLAETIARREAAGYQVTNQLTVIAR